MDIIFFIVVTVGLIEIISWALVRSVNVTFPWLIVKKDRYPVILEEVVDKFFADRFHPELGWCPKPYNEGRDITDIGTKSYKINKKGARLNPSFEEKNSNVAVFGDSYSFGRLVNDDETWPHLLSKSLDTNVINYSVGNYGFDQAFLRLKENIKDLESKIVIISVVPETIARVHSYWKHYYEYGNTLAFKPIFKLENNRLNLYKQYVVSKSSFFDIKENEEKIQSLDIFFESKFNKDMIKFPFSYNLLRTRKRSLSIIKEILKGQLFQTKDQSFKNALKIVIEKNAEHTALLYNEDRCNQLLVSLINEYKELCEDYDKRAIFVMSPQPIDLMRKRQGFLDYEGFLESIAEIVEVIDLTEVLFDNNGFEKYFVGGSLGPHLSLEGNTVVANHVKEFIDK